MYGKVKSDVWIMLNMSLLACIDSKCCLHTIIRSATMLLGMPATDRAGSITNRSLICEELLSSEYCTRSMCFCALRWRVQSAPLWHTVAQLHSNASQMMTWLKSRPGSGEIRERERSLGGDSWSEQCSPCLEVSAGSVI